MWVSKSGKSWEVKCLQIDITFDHMEMLWRI